MNDLISFLINYLILFRQMLAYMLDMNGFISLLIHDLMLSFQTLVYILDHLVILILARLLNDKGQCLPIEAEFVAALEEDVEKLSETIQELGLPKRMLAPRVKPLDHFMKLCKILAEYPKSGQGDAAGASNEKAKQTEEEEEEEKEGKGKGKGERVNIAKKSGAASKAGAVAAAAATAEFSLDDLEVGNVLGNMFGKARYSLYLLYWYKSTNTDADSCEQQCAGGRSSGHPGRDSSVVHSGAQGHGGPPMRQHRAPVAPARGDSL